MSSLKKNEQQQPDLSNDEKFWRDFEKKPAFDDGAAARGHLAAGRPITYRDRLHENRPLREWSDGRREVVQADLDGNVTVLQQL